MNVLGNRHVGKNIRILLINNAVGSEFKLYLHPASKLGEDANKYIAAGGHYGNKSPLLVKHYSEDLGFEYITASNKEEFETVYRKFTNPDIGDKPIIFEVFTDEQDESNSLKMMNSIELSPENKRKETIKKIVGENTVHKISKIIHKL
jgi:2-succinyl-5-enolpyruvyl-6-hydroxy-3-cyclohexene-1-carboxylate synthase